jgi:hypothetical protein
MDSNRTKVTRFTKIIEKCTTFSDFNDQVKPIKCPKEKGDMFKYLTYYIFKCHPDYMI